MGMRDNIVPWCSQLVDRTSKGDGYPSRRDSDQGRNRSSCDRRKRTCWFRSSCQRWLWPVGWEWDIELGSKKVRPKGHRRSFWVEWWLSGGRVRLWLLSLNLKSQLWLW